MILEKPTGTEDKKIIVLQPEDKTKWSIWQDLIGCETRNTANCMVFGVPLSTLMSRPINLRQTVPQILKATISFLDNEEFINEEGIWRKTGNLGQIERYIKRFDSGEAVSLTGANEEYVECHTATGLIKRWLGRLPQPLLTPYQAFIGAYDTDEREMETAVMKLVEQLPLHNISVLEKLCTFLYRVSLSAERNKMPIDNLALVVGPNVLRTYDNESSSAQLSDSTKICSILSVLIKHYEDLALLRLKLYSSEKTPIQKLQEKRRAILKTVRQQEKSKYKNMLDGSYDELPGRLNMHP
eukprot:TRINITY_DN2305_c0_g2_i2.p1 TRINITY_DN2305_c0_g2~~TRINITY_DN2305_c0_g2_i2.p1  ORF type:complete len:297 (+),score=65.42 TRINITY_DN2305_c0_g2_i2:546-1436(+)